MVAPRGATSSAGRGTNLLYALNNHQVHKNSPYVVTSMILVYGFSVYALLDPGASLYFLTPYVAMNFEIIHEEHREALSVSNMLVNPF